jgi:ABC-type uncharacterized transport system auxiliary subunit
MSRLTTTPPRRLLVALSVVALATLAGCGDDRAPEKAKPTGSHVWRGQTDMLFEAREQAKDVNAQLRVQEAALERARRGD